MLLNILTTVLCGLIFGLLWQSIIFMTVYLPLRMYAGGYHAKTHFRCYLYSTIMIIAVLGALKLASDTVSINILIVVLIISAFLIWMFSPVEDRNKPLCANEVIKYKRYSRIILSIITLAEFLCMYGNLLSISAVITLALLVLSITVIIGVLNNKFA